MQSFESLRSSLLPLFLGFIAICGPILIYIYLTKWRSLTSRYEYKNTTRLFSEGSFLWVGLRLPLTTIGVSVEVYPQGLWLKPGMPYSRLLPEILIPWKKIKLVRTKSTFFGTSNAFAIEGYGGLIKISGAAGKAIANKVLQINESTS